MNRILFEPGEIDAAGRATLDDARARHIVRVLRAGVGVPIRAGVVDGPRGEAIVESIDGERVTVRFAPRGDPPPCVPLDLLLALPRPKVLKRLWAQLAALGVRRILLTGTRRVESCYFASHVLEPAHYRPRLLEGLQQASDTRLPDVRIFRHLRAAVEEGLGPPEDATTRIVLDPHAAVALAEARPPLPCHRLVLAIGPEGGWSPDELAFLDRNGFHARCLGGRTLRSDTACIAALAIASAHLQPAPESPPASAHGNSVA